MAEKTKMLVIGGSGFIGSRLVQAASQEGSGFGVEYTFLNQQLPLEVPGYRVNLAEMSGSLEATLESSQPGVVVYVAVPPFVFANGAEMHRRVNVEGVAGTLEVLARVNPEAKFIYLSTNMVFGGGRGNYQENERPDPELRHDPYRAYGLTKAEGEKLALANWPGALITRTSVVDGREWNGQLYRRLAGIVETLQSGKKLQRFTDRYFSPTLVDNLVEALLEISRPAFKYRGVLHLAGSERCNDYDYARQVARTLGYNPNLIVPQSLAESQVMAGSPADSSLETSFTQSLLPIPLLNLGQQLGRLFPGDNY